MTNAQGAQDRHYDVIILGGGPSGTAAGLTLLKRIGESLSPGIRPLLGYLSVWDEFQQEQSLDSFGSRAAWGSPVTQSLDYMFTLHGTGWGLDRARFDRMLANAFAERGGRLLTQTRFLRLGPSMDRGWEVLVQKPGVPVIKMHCNYRIDATGRVGHLADRSGRPPHAPRPAR